MNKSAIQQILNDSTAGRIRFPQVVGGLLEQGVESYQVDLLRGENCYFNSQGEFCVMPNHHGDKLTNSAFDAEAVVSAIRKSQSGEINYEKFVDLIRAAGCTFYAAYLAGKKVIYFGRNGDFHIEHFPKK